MKGPEGERLRLKAAINRIGLEGATLEFARDDSREKEKRPLDGKTHAEALNRLWDVVCEHAPRLDAVGHRFVHGGPAYRHTVPLTPTVLKDLEAISPLDPNHLPRELSGVRTIAARSPGLPQFAAFDTGFHETIPEPARTYPLPRELRDLGIVRYGFHGLSYEYLMGELKRDEPELAGGGRVILAHLGSGSSLAAVERGKCVDTTMGFTPAAGLVMGTRTGDLDPGIIVFLARERKMTPDQLDDVINKRSGLLGVSGRTSDMADLLEAEDRDPAAALAVAIYCRSCQKAIAGMAAAMHGVDAIVFSGGIGENSQVIRERICNGLGFMGVPAKGDIGARVKIVVLKTNEELMIARSVAAEL